MPAKTQRASILPTDAERRSFGDLAEDIAFLRRGCHLTVAPFHGAFRIGTNADLDCVTSSALQARARREREARAAVPERKRRTK